MRATSTPAPWIAGLLLLAAACGDGAKPPPGPAVDAAVADAGQADGAADGASETLNDTAATDAQVLDTGPLSDAAGDLGDGGGGDVPGALCKSKADCAQGQTCQRDSCSGPGNCVADPGGCDDLLQPGCGCDGKTYGNPCTRLAAGVGKAGDGVCPSEPTCKDGAGTCDPKAFCAAPCGGIGVCEPKPVACDTVLSPVCGCDGKTYDSGCVAAQQGKNIASVGSCGASPGCGPGLPACAPGSLCDLPCSGSGTCVPNKTPCGADVQPVCGCDGKTYGNDCLRMEAGVGKAASGACLAPGGCEVGGAGCGKTAYCAGGKSGICTGSGACKPKPTACAEIYAPVCGCDGKTYSNECDAAGAGQNVAQSGKCPTGPGVCDGADPAACPKDEYCQGPCGAPGQCLPKPMACTGNFAPVCGCDLNTYSNACAAAAAGVNVVKEGECSPPALPCGGAQSLACPNSQVCEKEGCGPDAPGVCVPAPKMPCPKTSPAAQQCGCDGQTYANECLRLFALIAKASDGPCPPVGGCMTAATCAPGEGCKDGMCQTCSVFCTAVACPPGQKKDPCTCQCYDVP